jgi:hypothetical protein
MPRQIGTLAWGVVALVAVLVLGLVFGLSLYPRLDAGQRAVDGLHPAFAPARVAGDVNAISMVSTTVDAADPIVNDRGGAAAEVPKLVAFVSARTGLPQSAVLSTLKTNFPYTTNLLTSLPLSAVNAELPGLLAFLGTVLGASPAEVQALLKAQFPALTQVITALPAVTNGWDRVPGTEKLTRFDGSPVRSVPQVRDYFGTDVIPAVAKNETNFQRVDTYWPPVRGIPVLLTVIGLLVLLFALVMMARTARGRVRGREAMITSTAVLLIGVVVLGLVFGLRLYPRLDGGAALIETSQPIFTQDRVTGDVAAIKMVSSVVDVADPIMTADGAAAPEVAKLVGAVSAKTKLPAPAVVGTLQTKFPHVTSLLLALPLSKATAEFPKLLTFLSTTLKVSPADLQTALSTHFPKLTQVITDLPAVTKGWNAVPGTQDLTRFDGKPVRTVPQIRDYFAGDVIPAIAATRADFDTLATTAPALNVFPPLLTMIGILVIIYGIVLIPLWGRDPGLRAPAHDRADSRAGPRAKELVH